MGKRSLGHESLQGHSADLGMKCTARTAHRLLSHGFTPQIHPTSTAGNDDAACREASDAGPNGRQKATPGRLISQSRRDTSGKVRTRLCGSASTVSTTAAHLVRQRRGRLWRLRLCVAATSALSPHRMTACLRVSGLFSSNSRVRILRLRQLPFCKDGYVPPASHPWAVGLSTLVPVLMIPGAGWDRGSTPRFFLRGPRPRVHVRLQTQTTAPNARPATRLVHHGPHRGGHLWPMIPAVICRRG